MLYVLYIRPLLLYCEHNEGPKRVPKPRLLGLTSADYYRSTRSFTLFFALRYFSLFKLKVISNRLPLFSFPFSLSVVSSPKQAATVLTPALLFPPIFYPLQRGPIFLDLIPPLLLYIKHHFPLNKQFSTDSFLDCKGLHWVFSSMIMSPLVSVLYRIRSDAEPMNTLLHT